MLELQGSTSFPLAKYVTILFVISTEDAIGCLLHFLSRLLYTFASQINVFLRITGKRADSFHDLASLFHVSSFTVLVSWSHKKRSFLLTIVPFRLVRGIVLVC
jgi:hypothetical protein